MEKKKIKYGSNNGEGISNKTRQKWDDKIEFCIQYQQSAPDWALEHLDSYYKQRAVGKDLSWKQSKTLNIIFDIIMKELNK
jgi:hypothetical protein